MSEKRCYTVQELQEILGVSSLLFIIVADEVDSELLAKVLANPEMWAFLNSLAKTMK